MLVTYSLSMHCNCPVDNLPDLYDVEITSDKTIPVEDILMAIETVNRKDFQENITESLAREIPAKVKTTGYHSGIKVVCEA
jgi:NADPH-dependent 7-cyano-7-deazaguanine reductase QueF